MSAHNSLYIAPIVNWGNDAQKEKWVEPWVSFKICKKCLKIKNELGQWKYWMLWSIGTW